MASTCVNAFSYYSPVQKLSSTSKIALVEAPNLNLELEPILPLLVRCSQSVFLPCRTKSGKTQLYAFPCLLSQFLATKALPRVCGAHVGPPYK